MMNVISISHLSNINCIRRCLHSTMLYLRLQSLGLDRVARRGEGEVTTPRLLGVMPHVCCDVYSNTRRFLPTRSAWG
jgi:hypothetical protein